MLEVFQISSFRDAGTVQVKNTRQILSVFAIALCLASGTASGANPPVAGSLTKMVKMNDGPVQGIKTDGVNAFLGIPYAAAPVGELRWQPPQPAPKATQTLQAVKFQKTCPQPERGVFASPSVTEDCLYLNIFAPAAGKKPTKRPVMVWLHGGGLMSGESDDYDGSKLARRGDVVVVTLNYRLGLLGFFSHPALNAEGHPYANYGIMDQQFALQWIKRNIAAFGGDPGNVTIFGQSGGATAVIANLQSPTAAGLFHKAISQSGIRITTYRPEVALKEAQEFAKAAGCADQSAQCLRSLSVEQVLENQTKVANLVTTNFPVVDGTIITHSAFDAFPSGQFNRVPVMNGIVGDEQAFFLPELNSGIPMAASGYNSFVAGFGKQNIAAIQAKYPLSNYASPSVAVLAVAEDYKACTARYLDRSWAKFVPVYGYQFNDRTAPSYFRKVSYPMGAYHTSELQYLFPMFHGGQGVVHPLNAAQTKLSDQMIDYWTHFARTGKPADSKTTTMAWPSYASESDQVQYLDLPAVTTADAYGEKHNCALWDPLQPME